MKQIEGFDGYFASNDGNIMSRKRKTPRVMKTWESHDGYQLVQLMKDGKAVSLSVHRLIAKAFIPNPENCPQINHKNGIKTDNRVENLEWCSASKNNQHAFDEGLRKPRRTPPMPVIQMDLNGNEIEEFKSGNDAQIQTGIGRNVILAVCRGEKCRKSAGGFLWKFKNK